MPSHSKRRTTLAVAAACGLGLTLTAAPAHAQEFEVVASGLDSPRHLTVSDTGDLYVVEAGRGGDGPCQEHPALEEACFGFSGAITRVNLNGPDERVVTGLPSIAGPTEALGAHDVSITGGNKYVVSIGLGDNPQTRAGYGPGGALLATLLTGKLKHSGFTVLANVGDEELAANPEPDDFDSNPNGILRSGESYYVADSGGNAIVKANHKGAFSTVAVLPHALTTLPGPVPVGFPADAVPTSVVRGPDGALYVSQLTGFPFEVGLSSIWRIGSDGSLAKWATGLTNVTDLAFGPDGNLYAVEIAANGLLNGPIGALVRVTPGGSSHPTVAGGLFAPYGVAFMGHDAFVSICSVCYGGGQVVRIPL